MRPIGWLDGAIPTADGKSRVPSDLEAEPFIAPGLAQVRGAARLRA